MQKLLFLLVADYNAQAVISRVLSENFPEDRIVGEEEAAALRKDENAETRQRVLEALRNGTRAEKWSWQEDQVFGKLFPSVYRMCREITIDSPTVC